MSLVFFTDRDLGNQFPDLLAAAGLTVERHAAHFPSDCPDEDWLREVGRQGWVAITRDRRIRHKPNELDAVVRNRVTLLVLIGQARHVDLATNFIATVPRVERFLKAHPPPLIAKVY